MRRKGQHLAVESVLTFGLGLIVAIGTVTAFSNYRDQVLNEASARQVNVVESRMVQAVQTLDDADSGQMTVELPGEIGAQSYSVSFTGRNLRVLLDSGESYRTELDQFQSYGFQGSVEGGSVKVFKREDQFILRAD